MWGKLLLDFLQGLLYFCAGLMAVMLGTLMFLLAQCPDKLWQSELTVTALIVFLFVIGWYWTYKVWNPEREWTIK
jgi:uncharacterized membrane protein HdeD (DUF308 family)